MDFDFKWYAILMIGLLTAATIGDSIGDYNESQLAQASVAAGLEECPNEAGHTGDTIWVKSCSEFLSITKK